MTYGITLYNEADGLTLSDSGITFGYIGRANLVSISQTQRTENSNELKTDQAGNSVYTINWPTQIQPVLPLKTNGGCRLISFDRVNGSNTWNIVVHKASSFGLDENTTSFYTEEATEVYVFAAPDAIPAGQWGLAIYDDNNNLVADLSRRPLNFKQYVSLPTGIESTQLGSFVKPGIIGNSLYTRRFIRNIGSSTTRTTTRYRRSWRLQGSILVSDPWVYENSTLTDSGGASNDTVTSSISDAVIIELDGL